MELISPINRCLCIHAQMENEQEQRTAKETEHHISVPSISSEKESFLYIQSVLSTFVDGYIHFFPPDLALKLPSNPGLAFFFDPFLPLLPFSSLRLRRFSSRLACLDSLSR